MRFGISLPNNQGVASIRELAQLATEAEDLGFTSVWTSEHLFHSSYVAERLGDRPYHEALTVLTAAAMVTKSIRLGTSVLVLPWHHPVRLAKMVASLDQLSEGRVNLGIGVAITEDEYQNLGADFRRRGAIADDMLQAMRALWEQDFPHHDGPFFRFSDMRFEPKPVQSPLPIYVGGASPAALRRLERFGQVWHPLSVSFEQLRATPRVDTVPRMVIEFLDSAFDRPLETRKTLRGTAAEIKAMIQLFQEAGVNEIVLDPNTGDIEQFRRTMRRVAIEL